MERERAGTPSERVPHTQRYKVYRKANQKEPCIHIDSQTMNPMLSSQWKSQQASLAAFSIALSAWANTIILITKRSFK